jgi:hypothetical protein
MLKFPLTFIPLCCYDEIMATETSRKDPKAFVVKAEYTETARKARSLMTDASRLTGQLAQAHEGELQQELQSIEQALDALRQRMFKVQ